MPEVSAPSTSASVDQLASFRSEIDALLDRDVLTPRLDVAAAALVAIGTMPLIELHRPSVLAVFGEAGGSTLDRLVPAARAVMLAQAACTATDDLDLEPDARELAETRDHLFLAASALVERKLVPKKSLTKLTGGQSYQGRVVDTMALVTWFRGLSSELRAHTRIADAELDRAQAIADAFCSSVVETSRVSNDARKVARDRARMFTLFFRTYQRVRQMLLFLRWHEDDLEKIAPSLYAGRTTRKSKSEVVEPVSPSPTEPTPVVSPDMPSTDPFRT